MRLFVAGATGVLGRTLVPQLVAQDHEVVGMTRSASKQATVRSLGARPVVADALDPDAVAQAVASAEPEVIVHELTAVSGTMSIRDARTPSASRGRSSPTACGPRERTIPWPPRAPWGHGGSWRRATNRERATCLDHDLACGRDGAGLCWLSESAQAARSA